MRVMIPTYINVRIKFVNAFKRFRTVLGYCQDAKMLANNIFQQKNN